MSPTLSLRPCLCLFLAACLTLAVCLTAPPKSEVTAARWMGLKASDKRHQTAPLVSHLTSISPRCHLERTQSAPGPPQLRHNATRRRFEKNAPSQHYVGAIKKRTQRKSTGTGVVVTSCFHLMGRPGVCGVGASDDPLLSPLPPGAFAVCTSCLRDRCQPIAGSLRELGSPWPGPVAASTARVNSVAQWWGFPCNWLRLPSTALP